MDKTVPFIVYEAEAVRHERDKVRWFIIVLVLILLLFGSNAAWIAYESQFEKETVTQTVTQEADSGGNRFVGGDYYGDTDSNDNDYAARP